MWRVKSWKPGELFTSVAMSAAFAMLGACSSGGGDGGGGVQPFSESLTMTGRVYDGPLAGVTLQAFQDTQLIGSAVADANGNYTLTISPVSASGLVKLVATQGGVKLVSLVGSFDMLQSTAQGGTVSSETESGLNVTNVSTAIYALLFKDDSAIDDATQAQLQSELETLRTQGEKQLEIAGVIKLVVDEGYTLGAASDTLSLVINDANYAQFLALVGDNDQDGVNDLEAAKNAIALDETLATQFLINLSAADFGGTAYLSDNSYTKLQANGTGVQYDAAFPFGVPGQPGSGNPFTWTFDAGTQELTINLVDDVGNAITAKGRVVSGNQYYIVWAGQFTFDGQTQAVEMLLRRVDAAGFTLAELQGNTYTLTVDSVTDTLAFDAQGCGITYTPSGGQTPIRFSCAVGPLGEFYITPEGQQSYDVWLKLGGSTLTDVRVAHVDVSDDPNADWNINFYTLTRQ